MLGDGFLDLIGTVFLENDINSDEQLAAKCADGNAVRLALTAFFLVVELQFLVMDDGHRSRLPQAQTQIG